MKLLEGRARWGLWLSAIGAGVTTLYFGIWSVIHSFNSLDQSIARREFDLGCTGGLIVIALGVLLLTTRKKVV